MLHGDGSVIAHVKSEVIYEKFEHTCQTRRLKNVIFSQIIIKKLLYLHLK